MQYSNANNDHLRETDSGVEKNGPTKGVFEHLKAHKGKLLVGAAALALAFSYDEISSSIDKIKNNAEWLIPGFIATEALWNAGAIAMVSAAGLKVGNPLTLKARFEELKSNVADSKLFKVGLYSNVAGALGTAALFCYGSFKTLPVEALPSSAGLAALSAAPSIAVWNAMRSNEKNDESSNSSSSDSTNTGDQQ